MSECSELARRISTGIQGLDVVLKSGLIPRRRYLVRGGPGLGKTTLGLNFLAAGNEGEPSLFIGFQEPPDEIQSNAAALGIDTSSIEFLQLSPDDDFFIENDTYDVFAASDVEQESLSQIITGAFERIRPHRVFIDSLTQLRFMSADVYQFRRQATALLNYLVVSGHSGPFFPYPGQLSNLLPNSTRSRSCPKPPVPAALPISGRS